MQSDTMSLSSLSFLDETAPGTAQASDSGEDIDAPLLPPQPRRIQMHTKTAATFFPDELRSRACFTDVDGAPVFVGSALVDSGGVHPCKVTLSKPGEVFSVRVLVPLGWKEVLHEGPFEILVVDDETMEWVSTKDGWVPAGRSAVEGGYLDQMRRFYYAATNVDGRMVPGKAVEYDTRSKRAPRAYFSWDGKEHEKRDKYAILCWRIDFHVPAEGIELWDSKIAPFADKCARAPTHLALIPHEDSLQPGKVTRVRGGVRARTTYNGNEIDLTFPLAEKSPKIIYFDANTMHWVETRLGKIPVGVQPIEGGYDSKYYHSGARLYFAAYEFDGILVPGKTGEHLGAAYFPWCGTEHMIRFGYKILCWKRYSDSDDAHRSLVPPPPLLQLRSTANAVEGNSAPIGTAHRSDGSRHPGTAVRLATSMVYSHDGKAVMGFSGLFQTLNFNSQKMEWVSAKDGKIPAERRPIEGGYEVKGDKLYFARSLLVGPYVYGKTGEHLRGADFVKNDQHVHMHDNYDILCWKD